MNKKKKNYILTYFVSPQIMHLFIISSLFVPSSCFFLPSPLPLPSSSSTSSYGNQYSKYWNIECYSSHQNRRMFPAQKRSSKSASTSTFMQNYPFDTNNHNTQNEKNNKKIKNSNENKEKNKNNFFSNNFFHHPFFSNFSEIPFFQKKKKEEVSEGVNAVMMNGVEMTVLSGHTNVKEETLNNENEEKQEGKELNNNNNDHNNLNQILITPNKSPLTHTTAHTTTPLISFQTAGNWKIKKKTWLKYKKNTGWQDPYRDGEDNQNPLWRFFAEVFYSGGGGGGRGSVSGGGRGGSGRVSESGSGDGRVRERGGVEEKKMSAEISVESDNYGYNKNGYDNDDVYNNESASNHAINTITSTSPPPHSTTTTHTTTHNKQNIEITSEHYHDELQIGVIGYIKSETGTFFIRNNDTNIEFETVKTEKTEMSQEFLTEMELYKSIRTYAHPTNPKF